MERFKPRIEEIEVEDESGQKRRVKRLVFEEPVDARGFMFPEIPDEPINYVDERGNEYNQGFTFKYALLKNIANFSRAMFKGHTSFEQVHFEKGVNFIESCFLGYVDFSNTSFHEDVQLAEATFSEVEFFRTIFKGKAKFIRCVFRKGADFWLSKFNDAAVFSMSEFKEQAYFNQVTFSSKANFRGCIFEGYTTFSNSQLGDADFKYCRFRDIVEFWDTLFNGSVYFDNSSFEYVVSFESTDTGLNVRFYKILSFSNCDFRQGIKFIGHLDEKKFTKMFNPEYPRSLQEAARVQRLSYEKEGKRDEADRMFVLEMRAKRRARLQNAGNKFEQIKARVYNFVEWLLADLPSEYGTNWVCLFLFSLLVIIGNAVPYAVWSKLIDGFPETSSYFIRFLNALYYSLVTFTTLGYGDMHPTGWLKALSAIEALTGAVFMALIVAVIARKWMR